MLADRVDVPPGRVAVVRVLLSESAGDGALNVVTDAGVRYAVPSDDELRSLGYDPALAVPMPASLVRHETTRPGAGRTDHAGVAGSVWASARQVGVGWSV